MLEDYRAEMTTVKKVWAIASPVLALFAGVGVVVLLERRGSQQQKPPA